MHRAVLILVLVSLVCPAFAGRAEESKTYVGSKACESCHSNEFASFSKNAKKAHSFKSVQIMASKLDQAELRECYACHTTGYGKPGGFVSMEKNPELANAGCEVCHGPGSLHAQSGDKADIKAKLDISDCAGCHSQDRIKSFDFKPMLFGGAH